jgi:hypothetical protein
MAARVLGRTAGWGRGVYCEPTSDGGVAGFCGELLWAGELIETESSAKEAASARRRRENMALA